MNDARMRHVTGLSGLVGLTAMCAGACSIGNLTFTRTADQATVAKVVVANGASWIPPSADLGAALATCVDDLTVGLDVAQLTATRITPAPRTELHLFARTPNEMGTFLAGLTPDQIQHGLTGLTQHDFGQGLWNAQAASSSGFPRSVVVTWPATPGAATGPATTLALSTGAFWAPRFASGLATDLILCHPKGDAKTLQPGGTLHEAVIYNRGACRRDISLADFIGPGNQQLVDAIHTRRAPGVGKHEVKYSILQSAINDPGGAIDEPIAQLFLMLLFEASDLLGNATSPISGTVRYDFTLDNGNLALKPQQVAWNYSGVWGSETSEGLAGHPGWHQALTAGDGDMVTQINAQIRQQQLLGVQSKLFGAVLTGGNFACNDQTFLRQCGAAADAVSSTLGPLIRGRMTAGKPTFSDAEVSQMLCSIGDGASCGKLGKDRDDAVKARWTCQASNISADPYCDMTIPVSRLIASPDSLGVVFFDSDQLSSPAYALEAASPGSLCQADTAPPATRPFVSSVIVDP